MTEKTTTEYVVQYRDKRFVSLRDTWATWETYEGLAMAESLVEKLVASFTGVGRKFRIICRTTTETVIKEQP